jgi:hypothetical protein
MVKQQVGRCYLSRARYLLPTISFEVFTPFGVAVGVVFVTPFPNHGLFDGHGAVGTESARVVVSLCDVVGEDCPAALALESHRFLLPSTIIQ